MIIKLINYIYSPIRLFNFDFSIVFFFQFHIGRMLAPGAMGCGSILAVDLIMLHFSKNIHIIKQMIIIKSYYIKVNILHQ